MSNQSQTKKIPEGKSLNQIPILHVRGTHYEVGYTIGRQFRSMIEEILRSWKFLNEVLIPSYSSKNVRKIYDTTLDVCRKKFPNYVAELQGMADGSKSPFYKLFLMHLESIVVPPNAEREFLEKKEKAGIGCTSVMCGVDEISLGHTEDTSIEFTNNVYIVAADIVDENGATLEKFSTLTYPGHLPGYTMGFNQHGMIYSINTLYPATPAPGKTPRTFLTRAVLGSSNMAEVLDILRDSGTGTSDGFSLNVAFVNGKGPCVWLNVEVAPPDQSLESQLNVFEVPVGQCYAHCNRYIRLKVPQLGDPEFNSSCKRLQAIEKHEKPYKIEILKDILSDQSDPDFPIYRSATKPDLSKTVVAGIFDVTNRNWLIFTQPPSKSSPVAVIPMHV